MPTFIQQTGTFLSGVTSATLTPPTAVTPGNLMVVFFGGAQSRTVTPPAGWTTTPTTVTGQTVVMFHKIAGGSEPSSYTFNFNAALTGGSAFNEFADIDSLDPISHIAGNSNVVAGTTISYPTFAVMRPGIALAWIGKSSTSTGWTCTGFTVTGFTNYMRFGRKSYEQYVFSQSVSWAGSGSELLSCEMVIINAKRLI